MAYFIAEYDTLNNGVVTGTETVILVYPDATTCQAEEAAVNANETATVAARAQCVTAVPSVPAFKIVQPRNCSGGTTDESFDVIVTTDNEGAPGTTGNDTTGGGGGYTGGNSTGGTQNDDPAATRDLSGETDVTFYSANQ